MGLRARQTERQGPLVPFFLCSLTPPGMRFDTSIAVPLVPLVRSFCCRAVRKVVKTCLSVGLERQLGMWPHSSLSFLTCAQLFAVAGFMPSNRLKQSKLRSVSLLLIRLHLLPFVHAEERGLAHRLAQRLAPIIAWPLSGRSCPLPYGLRPTAYGSSLCPMVWILCPMSCSLWH